MKKLSMMCLLALGAWTFQACGDSSKSKDSTERAEEANEDKDAVAEDDSEFAVTAASGGMLEVELGQMAQQKSQNQRVKTFAAMMVTDHTKANEELKSLAAAKNVTLPTTMGEDHQKHIDDLSKLSGAEFDKEYVDLMVEDHEKDVKLFSEAADEAKDAEMKAFAAKILPTLQQHLTEIKGIKDSMKQ
ncbi:MAG: DUF4142 domain-containing protein [Cytophagaceae bacterium]|nr:DUF4142 domain-containing protein [Cytophagaceae bacterium]